jgi:hypothetical protein
MRVKCDFYLYYGPNEAPRSKLRGIKAELRRSYSNVK